FLLYGATTTVQTSPLIDIFDNPNSNINLLRLTAGGNLGLGQTTPTYKLDVTGTGHFTNYIDASYFVATSTTATSTFSGGLTANTLSVGALSGILKASGGFLTGSATTNDLPEGSNNLFYTTTRFDNRLSATSSLPNIATL